MVGMETRINLASGRKSSNKQGCANQGNQRQRDFGDYQRGTQTMGVYPAHAAAAGLIQVLVQVGASCLESRNQAGGERGDDAQHRAKSEYMKVQVKIQSYGARGRWQQLNQDVAHPQ